MKLFAVDSGQAAALRLAVFRTSAVSFDTSQHVANKVFTKYGRIVEVLGLTGRSYVQTDFAANVTTSFARAATKIATSFFWTNSAASASIRLSAKGLSREQNIKICVAFATGSSENRELSPESTDLSNTRRIGRGLARSVDRRFAVPLTRAC